VAQFFLTHSVQSVDFICMNLTMLGVIINDQLTVSDHVTELLSSCSRLLYAHRVLKARGLPQQSLQDKFRATVEAKLIYAVPAWSGFCSAGDRVCLNAFLCRCIKLGYRDRSALNIDNLFTDCVLVSQRLIEEAQKSWF